VCWIYDLVKITGAGAKGNKKISARGESAFSFYLTYSPISILDILGVCAYLWYDCECF